MGSQVSGPQESLRLLVFPQPGLPSLSSIRPYQIRWRILFLPETAGQLLNVPSFLSTTSLMAGPMSIPIHSRPLDPLLLEDGLVSGLSNMSSVGFGKSPESAMVDEIFNNPDVWSIQLDEERNADFAGAVDFGEGFMFILEHILNQISRPQFRE